MRLSSGAVAIFRVLKFDLVNTGSVHSARRTDAPIYLPTEVAPCSKLLQAWKGARDQNHHTMGTGNSKPQPGGTNMVKEASCVRAEPGPVRRPIKIPELIAQNVDVPQLLVMSVSVGLGYFALKYLQGQLDPHRASKERVWPPSCLPWRNYYSCKC